MNEQGTSFLTQRRVKPRFLLIALLMTTIVIGVFFYQSYVEGFGKRPINLIYAESWPASRTAADTVRAQNVQETARQAAIAEFEIERGQALRARAKTPAARAQADALITKNKDALARWTREHEVAKAVLAANPAPPPVVSAP